jgi:hypothetical protein
MVLLLTMPLTSSLAQTQDEEPDSELPVFLQGYCDFWWSLPWEDRVNQPVPFGCMGDENSPVPTGELGPVLSRWILSLAQGGTSEEAQLLVLVESLPASAM